ncbi:ATP-dependent endonuclease [Methylocystis sp.]|uniref:ATP-dependent nuclease n=1 Tax=Methylocystis sp. TaxID=1911079 RepID=UPI0025D0D244|nr:ATP-dependent endonuclease [Methylocystis sp.]
MHLHSYRIQNYRRLRDVRVELSDDISIFVGANNSGKTSATQVIQTLLTGSKDRLSLYDFSSYAWKRFSEIGELSAEEPVPSLPSIKLDLWFEVAAADLYLVVALLPSMEWEGNLVGLRVEFAARNPVELLQRFREAQAKAATETARLGEGAGNYAPWPKNLAEYLQRELGNEFELRYSVLDRSRFDDQFQEPEDYVPEPLSGEPGGASILKSLVRVDCLNAQRHLSDPSSSPAGRAEDLSKRLSRFYQRNLDQRQDDHQALKALFESEQGLNEHLREVFSETLKRIAELGYPGLNNPRLEIRSALSPESILNQNARVHYIVGDGDAAVELPDTYNGLGFKNLIYMVVELLDLQARWKAESENRVPLHLIFIEEPEAHLHTQLQQVFIRNVLDLLKIPGEEKSVFSSQLVVTTHSPHILYERGFAPIRYFRRHAEDAEQTTQVLNLSKFNSGAGVNDRDFLQRYLKLTHCDLFFADAAILVEGNVERLLVPIMIERSAKSLRSASICILEVGGAFGHRFKSLIEFLGITTLIVTDIDSVVVRANQAEADEDDDEEVDEDADKEAEVEGGEKKRVYAKACLPGEAGAVTSNQTLRKWLPGLKSIKDLLEATPEAKTAAVPDVASASVRVAYQLLTDVNFGGSVEQICGRTLEEAFGLENAVWCQAKERKEVGLHLKTVPRSPTELAAKLHTRVNGKSFNKTNFALAVLNQKPEWEVPLYIKEGLVWLAEKVSLEAAMEAEAAPTAGDAEPQPVAEV